MTEKAPHVYLAIAEIAGKLAKEGIAKNRKNEQGSGYKFRGIDDVYNALASLLAEHKLVILPRVTSREITERTSKSGGALFYVVLNVEFDFISAVDGSKHTVVTMGEAMDSGDKATNKAMSAAYKYAALLTFCIPTEGDNDSENQTHEVAPKKAEKKPVQTPEPAKPEVTSQQIKINGWLKELKAIKTFDEAMAFPKKIADQMGDLSETQMTYVNDKINIRQDELNPIGA